MAKSRTNSTRQLLAQIPVQYEHKNALTGSGAYVRENISNRDPGGISDHARKLSFGVSIIVERIFLIFVCLKSLT